MAKYGAWLASELRPGSREALGHHVVRVNAVMPVTSTDEAIVLRALDDERVVLTQDLRFSAILGRAGQRAPSLISLRLSSSRIELVNAILEDSRIRTRRLPIP